MPRSSAALALDPFLMRRQSTLAMLPVVGPRRSAVRFPAICRSLPSLLFSRTSVLAGTTGAPRSPSIASASALDQDVVVGKRVAARKRVLALILPPIVLLWRNCLKVLNVHARRVTAQMVKFVSRWDRPAEQHVSRAMRHHRGRLWSRQRHDAVAIAADGAPPPVAAVILNRPPANHPVGVDIHAPLYLIGLLG